MYKLIVMMGFLIMSSNLSIAHEGHDEPKSMPTPRGGITRGNENYFFEYVYKPGGGFVYLYTHDAKPAQVSGVEAKATYEIPRKKNVEAKVIPQGNSWKIEAELPKSHRITLKFQIKDGVHSDTIKFVVEPK